MACVWRYLGVNYVVGCPGRLVTLPPFQKLLVSARGSQWSEMKLCAYNMQECRRGNDPCSLGAPEIGDDPDAFHAAAAACEFAGEELAPYHYRSLNWWEREMYARDLALRGHEILEGRTS